MENYSRAAVFAAPADEEEEAFPKAFEVPRVLRGTGSTLGG